MGPTPQLAAGDWITAGARRWPSAPCLVSEARSQTFAETADRVERVSAGLRAAGLGPGDRIAVLATDSIEHVEIVLACLRAGVVLCDLNFRLRTPELATILGRAGATGIVHSGRYRAVVDELVAAGHVPLRWDLDGGPGARSYDELLAATAGDAPATARARGEDLVSIAFTSGTTGTPKGVLQSERMLRNIVYSGIHELGIRPGGFRYSGASLFHISGIGSVLYAVASGSASLILPQFDAPQVLAWMQHGGLTDCTLMPTMISSLLDLPEAGRTTYPELRSIMYGGASITPALLRQAIETYDCDLYNGFGAGTEAGGQTMLYPDDHRRAMAGDEHLLSSIGKPILGVDLRLCDGDLNDVPRGEVGEIVTRSETVMSGYLDQPELASASIVDGWFRAGDLARMDDHGYIYLATRKADMIIRGGENVYPVEIESVLAEHEAVAQVAVVGVPDDHWGEVVVAAVVPRAPVDEDALRRHCRSRLASYKVPEHVRFLADLPVTPTGKVLKDEVARSVAGSSPTPTAGAEPMPDATVSAFAARVERFFADRFDPVDEARGWGIGPDAVVSAALAAAHDDATDLARARKLQQELFDAGLAWIDGPTALGGAGLSHEHVAAFRAVARRYEAPDTSVFMIGQRIVAPAIQHHGNEAQQRRWLRALWRGDEIACQMFSEPDAGSDLASLRCRATPDGTGWRLSGQKVWSSGAHVSDVGELLARTEEDESLRHRGLSMFLVPLDAPGVAVRPLRQMNGNAHFNEVFLGDVWVPGDALLGERGRGWSVANASLTSERDLGPDDTGLFLDPVGRLVELARYSGASASPVDRQALADSYARQRLGQILHASMAERTGPVGQVGASLTKLYHADLVWRVAQRAASILGPAVTADTGEWGRYCWSDVVLGAHSQRIAGGTDEIQRNIIAERGLGLPRET